MRRIIPGRAIVIKLNRKEVRYIRQRLEEGSKLTYAKAWVENGYLYVALVFRGDVGTRPCNTGRRQETQ
ncbi:MAG: hypothetical protein QXP31_02180 [Pyrobaculum sp.]